MHPAPDCLEYTSLGDTNSEALPVNLGFVQGSTLAPLMFLVYINDLIVSFLILKFNLYADDTSVCLSGTNLNTFIENFNGNYLK